jgi:cysteine-rich repeat protein
MRLAAAVVLLAGCSAIVDAKLSDHPAPDAGLRMCRIDTDCASDCRKNVACMPSATTADESGCVFVPEDDGKPCREGSISDGVCIAALCRPHSCGDDFVGGREECDDRNAISGDGCEMDCTFSCHTDPDCDDDDPCSIVDRCGSTHRCEYPSPAMNNVPCGTPRICCDGVCATIKTGVCPM